MADGRDARCCEPPSSGSRRKRWRRRRHSQPKSLAASLARRDVHTIDAQTATQTMPHNAIVNRLKPVGYQKALQRQPLMHVLSCAGAE